FESEKIEELDNENYQIHGNLTLRGITQKIILDAELGGTTLDPWGNTRVGFSLKGIINRKDFEVSFGLLTDTGGIALSNEVKLLLNVQFVKQKDV
ncbi:MAG: YceI family protein, partial [Saprospiraceae bacterium]